VLEWRVAMDHRKDGRSFERRALLKGMAAGVAGAVAGTDGLVAHTPMLQPVAPQAAVDTAVLLDAHLRATLTSLSELLVPGSVAAGVVGVIDKVAAVDSPARQRQLLNAIARFDQHARDARGVRWVDLPSPVQVDLLRQISGTPDTERQHFDFLRSTVINTYLATEAGQREFGWTGQQAYRELPGCPHPPGAHD